MPRNSFRRREIDTWTLVSHSLLFFSLGGTNGVSAASVGSQYVSAGNMLCTLCSFLHEIFTPASLQLDQTGSIKCK